MLVIAALVILSVGLTTGCGRKQSTTTTVEKTNMTLGQELLDLEQAYEKGIISEKENNDLKKQTMKKYK